MKAACLWLLFNLYTTGLFYAVERSGAWRAKAAGMAALTGAVLLYFA